jgi:hypothetical protein
VKAPRPVWLTEPMIEDIYESEQAVDALKAEWIRAPQDAKRIVRDVLDLLVAKHDPAEGVDFACELILLGLQMPEAKP